MQYSFEKGKLTAELVSFFGQNLYFLWRKLTLKTIKPLQIEFPYQNKLALYWIDNFLNLYQQTNFPSYTNDNITATPL